MHKVFWNNILNPTGRIIFVGLSAYIGYRVFIKKK